MAKIHFIERTVPIDPIFAAIDAHKNSIEVLEKILKAASRNPSPTTEARIVSAHRSELAAMRQFAKVSPTSLVGAATLLEYVPTDIKIGPDPMHEAILRNVAAALRRMEG